MSRTFRFQSPCAGCVRSQNAGKKSSDCVFSVMWNVPGLKSTWNGSAISDFAALWILPGSHSARVRRREFWTVGTVNNPWSWTLCRPRQGHRRSPDPLSHHEHWFSSSCKTLCARHPIFLYFQALRPSPRSITISSRHYSLLVSSSPSLLSHCTLWVATPPPSPSRTRGSQPHNNSHACSVLDFCLLRLSTVNLLHARAWR